MLDFYRYMPETMYPEEYSKGERSLHPATISLSNELRRRLPDFEWTPAALMRLDSKIHNYLAHSDNTVQDNLMIELQANNDLADAFSELSVTGFKHWLNNPRKNIRERIRIHNENALRVAEKLKAKKIDALDTALNIETDLDGGKYYLAKLSTKEHFENESAWLKHCLGTTHIDDYLKNLESGEFEYFTIRERWKNTTYDRHVEILLDLLIENPDSIHKILPDSPPKRGLNTEIADYVSHPDNEAVVMNIDKMPDIPIVTIEYHVRKKAIEQVKTFRDGKANQRVTSTDPVLRATLEAVQYLRLGTIEENGRKRVRGVNAIGDLNFGYYERPILLVNGSRISNDAARTVQNPEDIVMGAFKISPDIPLEEIVRIAETFPITVDFSNATNEQRAAIITVRGCLSDSSKSAVAYPKLQSVGGSMDVAHAKSLDISRLKTVGGNLTAINVATFDAPELEMVDGELQLNDVPIISLPKLKYVQIVIATTIAKINAPFLQQDTQFRWLHSSRFAPGD